MNKEEFKHERKMLEGELNRLLNHMHNMYDAIDTLEKQRDRARAELAKQPNTPCEICYYSNYKGNPYLPCKQCPALPKN